MRRELIEETSIKSIKIIKELDQIYEYELPKKSGWNYMERKIQRSKTKMVYS